MKKITGFIFIFLFSWHFVNAEEKWEISERVKQLMKVSDTELKDSVGVILTSLFQFDQPFCREVLDQIGQIIKGRNKDAELLCLSFYPEFVTENRMAYLEKAYLFAVKQGIDDYKIRYFLAKSQIFRDDQVYDSSMVYLLKARNLAKKYDSEIFATALHQLGDIYYSVGLFDFSERYYNMVDSVKGSPYQWENWRESVIRNNKGLIAIERKEYDKALAFFEQSLAEISDSLNSFADSLRKCYDQRVIAYILYLKGDYDQAREMIKFPFEFAKNNKIDYHLWPVLETATLLSIATGDRDSAEKYYQLARELYLKNHASINIKSGYALLSAKFFEFLEEHEQSVSFYKEYIRLKDSLSMQAKTAALVQLLAEQDYNYLDENVRQIKKQRWLMLSAIALLVVFVLIIVTRSRKIMKLNRLLNETNQTKDKLFSIISHDLKSPFNSLLGFSELLQEDLEMEDLERAKLAGKTILQKSEELYKLMVNLLDWSRSQQAGFKLIIEKVEISACIAEVIGLYRDQSLLKQISVVSEFSDKTWVLADKTSLITIFSNLLSNAIKFTPEGGQIRFSGHLFLNFLEVRIADTGVGLTPDQVKTLFELTRASSEGTNHEKGTGLGLLIAREFIEKNGGSISVISKKNEGSTFTVSLRLA